MQKGMFHVAEACLLSCVFPCLAVSVNYELLIMSYKNACKKLTEIRSI